MSNALEVLEMIIADMKTDVEDFEGKPFSGKTLGELHGILAATIQAVAEILKKHLEQCDTTPVKHVNGESRDDG